MPTQRLLTLAPVLLVACAGATERARVVGPPFSLTVRGRKHQGSPRDGVPADDVVSVNGATSRRVSCRSFLSARAVCVRTRGGANGQVPGANDYSSTLYDQSQPWWTEDEKTHLIRPVTPTNGGFFTGSGGHSSSSLRLFSSSGKKNQATGPSSGKTLRSASQFGRASEWTDSLSAGGWLILTAVPAVLLVGSMEHTDGGQIKPAKPAPALSSRPPKTLKPPPTTKAAVRPAKVVKPKAAAVKPPQGAKPKAATVKPKVKPATPRAGRGTAVAGSKHGAGGGGGGGGNGVASLALGLVPESAYLRAAGVLALAVLGNGGLYKLQATGKLRSSWFIPFWDPWQVLTAVAWAVNMRATFAGGRLDGSSNVGSSNVGSSNVGSSRAKASAPQPVRFFTPASWAFAIWGPIFLGELLFVLFQLLPLPTIRGSWWLGDVSPWFAGAMLFQTLWCASFRPWARDAGLLWLPALMLAGVATALGGAHGILREAWFARDMELPQFVVTHLPLSLHFGWISCASLVNLNGYFASVAGLSHRSKLALSVSSVVAAVALGAGVTLTREDPLYPAVVAWALWAVGSEAGWSSLQGRVDPGAIRVQELAAKVGSVVVLIVAGIPGALALKDVFFGGGNAAYDEDY